MIDGIGDAYRRRCLLPRQLLLGVAIAGSIGLGPPAVAEEPPICTGGAVIALNVAPSDRVKEADGLVLARAARGTLVLWVESPDTHLNQAFGVLLAYGDGRECVMNLPTDRLRGVRLTLPRSGASPVAVEAGLCSDVEMGCLPVRLDLVASH